MMATDLRGEMAADFHLVVRAPLVHAPVESLK